MTRVKLTNGFPNSLGRGTLLTAEVLEGQIEVQDCLILPDGTRISILEVELVNIRAVRQQLALTVSRSIEKKVNWNKLFGSEIEVEKNTSNNRT